MTSRRAMGSVLFITLSLGQVPMVAEAADAVDAVIRQANDLRRHDRPKEALERLRAANSAHPSARLTAQIGLVLVDLEEWVDAEQNLAEALESREGWVRRNRKALEETVVNVRSHIGQVLVGGTPGAMVTIGGKPSGELPMTTPTRVGEGDVLVEVTQDGHVPFRQRVAVKGGDTVTLEARLAAVRKEEPIGASAGGSDKSTQLSSTTPGLLASTPPKSDRGDGSFRVAGYSLLGASVLALGAGVALLAINGKGTCDAPPGGVCPKRYHTELLGLGALGAGGAAAVAGGILLWKGSRAAVHASPWGLAGTF